MAVIGATPAAASGGASYTPVPDTLALLMLDSNVTLGTARAPVPIADSPELRRYDVRGRTQDAPPRTEIAAFEGMRVAPQVDSPFGENVPRPGFTLSFAGIPSLDPAAGARAALPDVLSGEGARYAVRDALSRRMRPPTALEGRLVLRIDGQTDSPVLSIGGGIPAAVLNTIPRLTQPRD
ncbi:hypothetical protein ACFQ1E_17845 [Sphingomonas canadensis]|uniref:Uncharacterized protein n=1 Tax=Sphingomonas canadensis TaxID=1219257 RepID=A0ABW3H9T4_9SPHN|nr:hypothetical protein [Sphingomonas canadensis]MCW3837995.1 hypothetical protein [Sphingomonas canadensis]